MKADAPNSGFTVPRVDRIAKGVVTLADHEAEAKKMLDANAWAYFSGGAGDELTLRDNRESWDRHKIHPRVLRDFSSASTRSTLLGRSLAHPILVAPMAYQRLAHPDGELGTAHAAAALGVGFVLSMQASVRLETIAQAVADDAGRGPLWFQLALQGDWGLTCDLVQRAEACGFEALVLTVDSPTNGYRDRERRVNFQLPPDVRAVNLIVNESKAHSKRVLHRPEQLAVSRPFLDGLAALAPTWPDVVRLQEMTRLPVVLKGVLHEADATQAASLGIAGVIVSNHGGRTLDTSVATADVLERIAAALDRYLLQSPSTHRRTALLVDGGIRRGTDVLKALALGADAVLLGRPCIHGLANAGAVGVAHVLRLLCDELEVAMTLSGCATLQEIDGNCLFQSNFGHGRTL